ncbi:HIRA protein [Micromonas commoda]|uniref:Protein HIRA n=1 Tax=Micromonas commoda (strain RCC299 / NOUM17 / CCMP2709) TaxID=296587 RepID=C1DXY3_MICCC|nr:HIRA protein [Micromonas commoda]ACO61333.1 HIRA protein [Micromonas commoda]|eukprot:XP_002500075.1 HIRA protein [Micromonas commoda]
MVHIYKPEFVKHDGGSPIFSVDCHPDGTRMATAGGDQKVKLWNLEALKKREVEADPNVPRVLATLSDHFNTVNCVRFSKNGRFLASGSTDSNVFLYEKRPGPGRAQFGSTDEPNVENWVNCQALRGHVSDVIDIAWAPDDSMLASCSLDNLIIVWDPATGQRVTTLKGHTSFVKGVAWDPIGKFLATQADDKSCIVWRVDDWSVVSKITEPYQSSMGATFSLRLSWSPDGKAVTTCNSYKKPSHTASVLERGDWGSKFDFVGHKGPVVTVRFSPALFKAEEKQDAPPHTVIACGSQDCKMTVWATNRPKPVCIVKTCFTQSVVDLCWSPDGYSLIACSTDGTVAIFTFDEKELGVAMSDEAKVGFLSETYGDLRRRVGPILEDPSLLRFEQQHGTPGKPPLPQPAAVAPTAELQLETRASDGRRRIMPVPQGGTAAAPMPMPMPAFPVAQAPAGEPEAVGPTMLEARNSERHSDVVCSTAGIVRWTDRCSESRATHIAGTKTFAAVFFENCTVQLYTPAGRRAMPPLVTPGRAAFVSASGGRLVAVTGDCSLIVWDLGVPGQETQVMRESVAPLLSGPRAPPAPPMVGVRLAKCGSPIAQFADGHAYVFHPKLKSWARVADQSFPRSEFTTRLRLPAAAGGLGQGELHALQVAAARAAVGMGPSALLSGGAPAPRRETGRHLECLLAAADMLGSQAEYRAWLRAYSRHLAAEGAEGHAHAPLREMCMWLLGPLSGGVDAGDEEVSGVGWVDTVAGGLKKRALLEEIVLPALASNRASQRLVGEVNELLEEAKKRSR